MVEKAKLTSCLHRNWSDRYLQSIWQTWSLIMMTLQFLAEKVWYN